MKWEKKGLIYRTDNRIDWAMDRAIAPVCELLSDQKLRIYFSTRDKSGRSTPVFLESNPEKPENIYNLFSSPILQFGPPGTFDDNGILVSSIVTNGDTKYLYYVGWNRKVEVPYHLSIGLAISDGDAPFRKISDGPILDRSDLEPYFCTAPFVLKENDSWKMWYVSGTGWKKVHGQQEPLYNIKSAASHDGIHWTPSGIEAIVNDEFAEAIGKPYVFFDHGLYKMIYSYRNSVDYRTDRSKSYRLGYAESPDGVNWTRMDDKTGITLSEEGWDSIMMEYASGFFFKGKRYLVYNGNGFGESGFGYAILKDE